MKKFFALTIIIAIFASLTIVSCTQNERARVYGGTQAVVLPKGQKLINATWKNSNLWYLTRPFKQGETPEKYTFSESSNLGIMNGVVYFIETN